MKNIFLISALAVLWWIGGMFAGLGISAYFGADWIVPCAALNMIAGLVMLLLITRDETARRLFYEGPKRAEPGNLVIAVLWILPFSLLFAG